MSAFTFDTLRAFYLSTVWNAGLLLVMEYFHSVVLVLLLKQMLFVFVVMYYSDYEPCRWRNRAGNHAS